MSNNYLYSTATTHGKYIQQLVSANQVADDITARNMALFAQMLDGDGSLDAHYESFRVACGFASQTIARAAYSELLSFYAKTNGNGSVTNVRAARDQMIARLTV